MKKKSTSQSAFFNLRVLIAALLCLASVAVALLGMGAFSSAFAQAKRTRNNQSTTNQDASGTQKPDVVRMVGPAVVTNLRDLPYVPPKQEREEETRLTRSQFPPTGFKGSPRSGASAFPKIQSLLEKIARPVPTMPAPLLTFDGINFSQSGCGCYPPDTNGDVGPNHYVQSVNVAFQVFDKNGNSLTNPIQFDTFFGPLPDDTPCGAGQNQGDPFVFYDQIADRWVITDFAFPSTAGPFYECVGVSQTPDPTGAYSLYALQVEPAHPDWVGDYPKLALWNNPQPGGAYHLSVNLFDFSPVIAFEGVRVFALDRGSMLSGGPANAVAFTIGLAGVGDAYSLQPAGFRTGNPPPAGRDEFYLAVDATFPGVTLTQVHAWLFHVDFVTPANSTFGLGADHTPNGEITVNPFVQAWTAATYNLVPQPGTSQKLDTLGDKIMTPVVYQNRNGIESLWADQTTMLNFPSGPTAVTWYQFDVTGGTIPATPVQQQEWTNGNDGLFRWMPSIAVDQDGNTAIGYSTSKGDPSGVFPSIRYAGRLAGDPLNDLGQGEAIMTVGNGSQLGTAGRWGDYTMTTVDTDGRTIWHTNEYYLGTATVNWFTRVGKFQFPAAPRTTPTPRPRPTPPPRP